MRISLVRVSVMLVLVASLVLLIAAQPAAAAEYTEQLCTSNEYTNAYPDDSNWDDKWGIYPNCPNGFIAQTVSDAVAADLPGEFVFWSTEAQIESVSLHVQRDPGIKVSARACEMNTCGAVVSTSGDLETDLTLDRDTPGQVLTGAITLKIYIQCEVAFCPAESSALLSDIAITRSDDTPPVFEAYEALIEDGVAERLPEASRWNNDAIIWNYEGGDLQSRELYFKAEVEGDARCYGMFDPDMPFTPDCPNGLTPDYVPFNAKDMADGYHEFFVTVANRALLTTMHSFTFRTDATPPGQPFQFEVSPHFNGWQSSRDVRIDWTNPGEKLETLTESGIAGYRYDVAPKFGGANEPTSTEDPEAVTVNEPNADSLQLRLPSSGQWTVEIETFDRAGNFSPAGTASINIDDARMPAAAVAAINPINANARLTGATITWVPGAAPVSGVCGYDWAFSTVAGFNPGEDPSTPMLSDDATELELTASQVQALSERPQRFHLRGYSCAGVPGEVSHEPVIVDFTAPKVTISPGSGTLASGEPVSIGVEDVKPGTIQSGVASVSCVVNVTSVACANGSQLHLPTGDNHLVVTATDVAGNSTTAEATLVADGSAPTGWIDPADPADPTLVRATVVDADSGVRSADLEYRPAGGGSWTKFGNGFATDAPTRGQITLSARIPDEGELANGDYLLRVRASDATGAIGAIVSRAGGDSAGFSIPLRSTPVLTAGLAKRSGAKGDPLSRLGVEYGQTPVITGRLKRPDGSPIAGAQLTIVADQPGMPAHTIATVTTSGDGAYEQRIPVGGNRRLTVRFGGNLAARSSATEALLRVRGKVTLKASRKSVQSKKTLHLRGKVFAEGATLPLIGKEVKLRFTIGGRRSGATMTRRTDAAGHFDFPFSYRARGRAVRFSVRAVSSAEPTWAFDEGVSKPVEFVVKP